MICNSFQHCWNQSPQNYTICADCINYKNIQCHLLHITFFISPSVTLKKAPTSFLENFKWPSCLLSVFENWCSHNDILSCFPFLQMVKLGSFWENQVCVIHFLRRFGWPLCRLGAKQLSAIKPQLDANNVRLVGVGVEELGVEEFVQGKYWSGGKFHTVDYTAVDYTMSDLCSGCV